ncbi:MAG: hypothetical protein EXR71_19280 [Myxococcales bacterium]|nr:hypothetical protein [Myxococcales bacterium]
MAVRRREIAELEAALAGRRAEMGELEDRLRRARQADAARKPGPAETPSLLMMVREPDPEPYAASSAGESPTIEERVLVLLRTDETPKSPAEIANALGVSESKARVAVKAVVGGGSAEPVKVGRATKYTVPKAIGLFTPHPERS